MDTLIDLTTEAFNYLNTYFWRISFVFLVGLGIIFTLKMKGFQILRIKETASLALSTDGSKHPSKLSSFETFCLGMGARIGVGNIAGVATAIATGGPGAVFWMWIFAIIGSASSFMESTLAQIYKEPKSDGSYHGGPAYYATKGLKSRTMGVVVAILLVITFGIGFVSVQACNASSALCGAFEFDNNNYVFAAIIAIIAAVVIFGGIQKIGKFSAKVVPIAAFLWIIFALIAMCLNYENIGNAVYMIFEYAFDMPALIGGGIGTIVVTGLKRGVFSNEAGLGSVANIAATADVKHPVKQGLVQSFGVLVDTLLVCTVTALVVLSYGAWDVIAVDFGFGTDDAIKGSNLVQNIVASTAIGEAAKYIIAGFLFIFAFTSLIGYYTISESNARFAKDDPKFIFLVRIAVVVVAFVAATVADVSLVDTVSDTFMAAMAAVNMLIVCLLSRQVFEAYADYRKQKREGVEDPVFHKDVLSDSSGVTEWE